MHMTWSSFSWRKPVSSGIDKAARTAALTACVAIGLKETNRDDLVTLKQNLDGVLAIDDFIGKRPSLLDADEQLQRRLAKP